MPRSMIPTEPAGNGDAIGRPCIEQVPPNVAAARRQLFWQRPQDPEYREVAEVSLKPSSGSGVARPSGRDWSRILVTSRSWADQWWCRSIPIHSSSFSPLPISVSLTKAEMVAEASASGRRSKRR